MPYKDHEIGLLSRQLRRLKSAIKAGRTYVPRNHEVREARQRRKLYIRVIQAIYHRLKSFGKASPIFQASRERMYAKRRIPLAQRKRRPVLTACERKDARLLYKANRRARKHGAVGNGLSLGIRKRLWFLQKGRCAACLVKLVKVGQGKYHLDHREPLARGGAHEDGNMQLLCRSCNLRKAAKRPEQFMQECMGKLL